MKTSSKRRVLVSSVSMLLVSMLALGTATFAWFTQNTTATAEGVYAKSVKTSSLELSKKDLVWSSAINYDYGKKDAHETLFPTSSDNGTTWYYAKAADVDESIIGEDDHAYPVPKTAMDRYVYREMLNIKNAGTDGNINDITISVNFGANADYARVAIVPASAPTDVKDDQGVVIGKEQGEILAENNAAFTGQKTGFVNNVFSLDGQVYDAIKNNSVVKDDDYTTEITPLNAQGNATINVGQLAAGKERYYNLYVWFEGQDEQCIDEAVGQKIENLTITVQGKPDEVK